MSKPEVETLNDQFAAVAGNGDIVVLHPMLRMSREQAIRHAAYLVVLTGATLEEFALVRAAILNT